MDNPADDVSTDPENVKFTGRRSRWYAERLSLFSLFPGFSVVFRAFSHRNSHGLCPGEACARERMVFFTYPQAQ
ncbi:MAG TPA: hypothetical protein DEA96_06005 [Leptospiraceae bacterium]|nr:hypothetical protein [Leptospiraceae bacterium]